MSQTQADCRVRSAEDLLGAVPFLIGFHPADSIVAVFAGSDKHVRAVGRMDLDAPPAEIIAQFRAALGHTTSALVLVGYGSQPDSGRLDAIIRGLRRDVPIVGSFWVSANEYRCVWDGCRCSATHGVAFDPRATVSAATLVVHGETAAASRAEVVSELGADPDAQAAISAAITHPDDAKEPFTVADALRMAERGQRLSDAQAAALAVLLCEPNPREQAWLATDGQPWQRQLWFDLTRRVPDSHAGPVATLAAWWAWRTGNEVLAGEALRRAMDCSPRTGLTPIVGKLITAHIDPASVPWPMTRHAALPTLRMRA
ncbi:hypothetical protein DMB66_23915 [Actinoplanes sp. ATCC 53533]|uniref:DUF4192 domain-containing protein n=1 Tax=Actinoplanes sp. ATCC 53533 TaxID=1288362 RepID=UPI000F77DD4F|nr:DUF4192 domain-containing protein [Actinoplanes sp. ATCC 53533]RSM61750.1 hypothetical protein DMB66_23915 [Actinoplanes sp. ATCC 53533]